MESDDGDRPMQILVEEVMHRGDPPLVFCPLAFERRAFLRFGKLPVITTGPGAQAIRDAFAARANWPVRNPEAVVLLGLAGALDPALPAGSAVRIRTVLGESGECLFESPILRGTATVVEAGETLSDPSQKRALAARSGAQLVDLESRAFAECASRADLPWTIVRGVSDDAATVLPPEFPTLVDARGETRLLRVLAALLRNPRLIAGMRRIGRDARRALRDASFEADATAFCSCIDLCTPASPFILYGGSFDPPHERHATMLEQAMRSLHARVAMVMPAALNPLKSDHPPAPSLIRAKMCRATFGGGRIDFPAEVRLSLAEILRSGRSYTIDTVRELIEEHPTLAGAIRILIGSDAFRDFERWRDWRALLSLARPAIVVRPPDTHAGVREELAAFAERTGFADAPSWLLDIPPFDLSSTAIRAAIMRGERPDGISDGVWREIREGKLYRPSTYR